jgi:hypothetical protein
MLVRPGAAGTDIDLKTMDALRGYMPGPGSPCIDAGIDRPWMTGATDLDGNPRVQGGGVDIGCYELVPEPIFFATFAFALLIIKKLRHRA